MLRIILTVILLALPSSAVTISGARIAGGSIGEQSSPGGSDWSRATSCTDGVNCFCDGPISEFTNLNRCYDWEDAAWDDEYVGSGALYSGPSGLPDFRGGGGIFQTLWGGTTTSCAWTNGVPASPNIGSTCGYSACAAGPWSEDDWLQANSFACFATFTDGEVNLDGFESGDITLDGVSGTDPFDGARYWAERVAPGRASGNGASISGGLTTYGLTMAFAYPQTLDSSHARNVGVTSWGSDFMTQPWKHLQSQGSAGLQFPMGNTGYHNDAMPFGAGSTGASNCSALVSGATQLIGSVTCQSGVFRFDAAAVGDCTAGTPGSSSCDSSNEFDRSRDWPLGTWACVRSKWGPHNSSDGEIYIDFQGPNDSAPRRILHITGLNFASHYGGSIGTIMWDTHYNGSDTGLGSPDPNERPMHRFTDNMVIVNGEPPTCSEIGF